MIEVQILDFDWDEGNQGKCQKHGLALAEIEVFFRQEQIFITPDIKHSQTEQRFLAMGQSPLGKPMFVVFTLRGQAAKQFIRPISARYMHQREVQKYEQEIARLNK
ncbi:MAG: BrnT family toxin [Anaerolineales bacterium]|nr:BrnT family toxin [Anaerolineales bacterium]